jgi:hypothetical protein
MAHRAGRRTGAKTWKLVETSRFHNYFIWHRAISCYHKNPIHLDLATAKLEI